jgi:Icc-related predicted phosphoesterase
MKLLSFVDLHGDNKLLKKLVARAKKEDIDFVVAAGDLTQFETNLDYILNKLDSIEKPGLIIHGNHEEEDSIQKAVKKTKHCKEFHEKEVKIKDFIFLGYGGGGFSLEDPEFRKIARKWYGNHQRDKVILVTHAPPFGTSLDKLDKRHVGNKDIRSFIERIKPKLVICGHIHETAGKKDKLGETPVIHPGWEGMVVEL